MKKTLKSRLAHWLQRNPGFHASGGIQRMVAEKTNYTPQNVGRRLRELTEEGVIEVQYRVGHAYYRYREPQATVAPSKGNIDTTVQAMSAYFESLPVK